MRRPSIRRLIEADIKQGGKDGFIISNPSISIVSTSEKN